MNVSIPGPGPIGWFLALAAGLLAIVFIAIGQLDLKVGLFIVALALARLW